MIFVRWAISMTLAVGVTFGLFYLMQSLIASGENIDQQVTVVRIVDATMPEIDIEVIEEMDRPEPIEDLNEPPPEVENRSVDLDSGPSLAIARSEVNLDADLNLGNASISITDGEMLPTCECDPAVSDKGCLTGHPGLVSGELHRRWRRQCGGRQHRCSRC